MKHLVASFIVLLLLAGSLPAQTTWTVDKSHSKVQFTVTHLMITEVTGTFKDFDVTITQGKEDWTGSTVVAAIKTASVNTENENRDKHMISDDFFNAEKFPELKFVSTSFEKTGKDTYKISGNLTIRDVTKPVVLDAKWIGQQKDPWGNVKVGFKATTSVNRMDYGVKWNKALEAGGILVSENVEITLNMQLQQKQK